MVGLLRRQVAATIEGLDAFAAWCDGEAGAAHRVREAERRGDAAKRELLSKLRAAFVTPLEPEDLFALSRGADRVLNYARDLVNESEVMDCGPDAGIAEMATLLCESVRHVDEAIARVESDGDEASREADAALAVQHHLDDAYYRGMAALLELDDRTGRIALRELYRRCARIGETVADVAEQVIYAVVKQS